MCLDENLSRTTIRTLLGSVLVLGVEVVQIGSVLVRSKGLLRSKPLDRSWFGTNASCKQDIISIVATSMNIHKKLGFSYSVSS